MIGHIVRNMPVKRPSHEVQSYSVLNPRFFGVRRGYHFNAEFRIKVAREHRAIVGVSMGTNQTMRIIMNKLDKSAYIGLLGIQ